MKKQRKVPMRKCIGCGESKSKFDLVRIVKNKENEIFVDDTGKANGRGAYICKDPDCLNKAIKTHALNKAFGMNISDSVYEDLKSSLIE